MGMHPANTEKAKPQMVSGLLLGLAVLMSPMPSFAQDPPATRPAELRELRGKDRVDAQKAGDSADVLRADFEKRYSSNPLSQLKPSSPEARPEAEKIIAAYSHVVDSYPNTAPAAHAGIGLAGFYQYLGQTTRAIDTAREVAATFENTSYAPNAAFAVGLLYLQAAHNPAEAMKWFQKVPPSKEGPLGPEDYDQGAKLYLSAQKQVASCALSLGRRDVAQDCFSRLMEKYPMFRDSIRREADFLSETSLHPDLRAADEAIKRSMAALDKTAAAPSPVSAAAPPPLPSERPPPIAAERPVTYPRKSDSWRYPVGWCLLALGIGLSVLGIVHGLRTRQRKEGD